MNKTKKLLIGLAAVAAMPVFADTKTATTASGESRLEALFKADLQYKSDADAEKTQMGTGRTWLWWRTLPDAR